MKERVIYLKDLFYMLCRKWVIAVVVMLVFALLMDAYAWNGARKEAESTAANLEKNTLKELQGALSEREISEVEQRVENYLNYYQQYMALSEYMEKSIYFNLDPKAVPTYYALFYADIEEEQVPSAAGGQKANQNTDADVLYAVNEIIQSEEVEKKVAEALGISEGAQYARELYKANISGSNLFLTVYAATESDAQMIGQIISGEVEEKGQDFRDIYGDYTLVKVEERVYTGAASAVASDINAVISRDSSIESILRTCGGDNLSKDAKAYYNELLNYEEEASKPAAKKTVGKVYPKWILVGLLLGLLAYIVVAAFVYILSDKIKTPEEVEEYFGIPVLAEIRSKKADWLDKAFTGKRVVFDAEEGTNAVIDRVLYRSGRKEGERLMITAEADSESVEEIARLLSEKLGSLKEETTFEKGMSSSGDIMQKLQNADGIMMIVLLRKSAYGPFLREMNAAKEAETKVIGAVVLRD